MNITNKLKQKVINKEILNKEEIELFLKYIIHKSIIITEHMKNKQNYKPIFLLYEICYSYDVDFDSLNINNNYYYAIVNISDKKYLIDLDFNNNKISKLRDNKYLEYNEDIYSKYLEIVSGDNYE